MTRKERFNELLKKHNYTSLNNFCIENKLQQANFSRRINDESMEVNLPTLFKLARLLHEPIDTLIEIFYPEEMQENRNNIE